MKRHTLFLNKIVIFLLVSSCLFLSCCSSGNKTALISDMTDVDIDDYRNKIRNAIIEDDAAAFAFMVRYPIYREYPLRDIADSSQMVRYYQILVDDSLKRVFEKSSLDDWGGVGWRGTTLYDGSYLWCDEGDIYIIPYQSEKELEMLDSLRKADMSTLPDNLAKGWQPESCLIDSLGTIYRIDKQNHPSGDEIVFRLLVYQKGHDRYKRNPSTICYGTREYQGSAGTPVYTFSNPDGSTWTYCFYWYEDKHFLYIETPDKGKRDVPLGKFYWLE